MIAEVAADLEDELRLAGPEIPSERSGSPCWNGYAISTRSPTCASPVVYKDFDDPADFQREIRLLTKSTAPKRHGATREVAKTKRH